MRAVFAAVLVTILAGAAVPQAMARPAVAMASSDEDARNAKLDEALTAIQNGKPAEAVAILDPVLADYEHAYKDEKMTIFCGMSPVETLLYMAGAAVDADKGKAKSPGAIAIAPGWCNALWAKGFALIDLKRVDEGVTFLERAVAKAPAHSHFLSELGYGYQQQRKWKESLDSYSSAVEHSDLIQDELSKKREKTLGWRGMGFALIEMNRWDEAKAVFEKCLVLDPNDQKAEGELRYIAEHRPTKS